MSNRTVYRTSTEQVVNETKRIEFVTARNQALQTQRDAATQRLAELRTSIGSIHNAIMGGAELSDTEKVLNVLERHRVSEQKLVDEITRLTVKMSR